MKYLIILSITILVFTSCRKTTACVESDITTAKIGQEIVIHNCSIKFEDADFILGEDGARKYHENDFENDEITIAYHSSGSFEAEMEVVSKNEKKKDKTTLSISIDQVDASELIGEWEYYKMVEDFDYSLIVSNSSTPTSGTLTFLSDSTYTDIYGYEGNWEYTKSIDRVMLGSQDYYIFKLYNNELVLRQSDFAGFSYLHYYTKK